MRWNSRKNVREVIEPHASVLTISEFVGRWEKRFALLPVYIFHFPYVESNNDVQVVWLEEYWTRNVCCNGMFFRENSLNP